MRKRERNRGVEGKRKSGEGGMERVGGTEGGKEEERREGERERVGEGGGQNKDKSKGAQIKEVQKMKNSRHEGGTRAVHMCGGESMRKWLKLHLAGASGDALKLPYART